MKFTDSRKSRIALFLAGILAGVLCRLSDFCPYESLWSFSSVTTLFGFWIASVSVITMHSVSHRGRFPEHIFVPVRYDDQLLRIEISFGLLGALF